MSGADFFDTNVFIYLIDDIDLLKQQIAQRLIAKALGDNSGCISHQVIQETLHVITQKFAKRVPPEVAAEIINQFLLPLWRVMPSAELYQRALGLQSRYGYSFYDSLIVAAALGAGCSTLYSEDMQHGQQIETLTIRNPFINSE